VQLALSSGEALLALLTDVLDLSRIEAGRLEIQEQEFRLRPLLQQVHQLFRVQAQRKGLDLSLAVEPQLPDTLITDPTRLRQVLTNLVGNAVKFTETGAVRLEAMRDRKRTDAPDRLAVHFVVHDTGPGIPEEERERIFAPFEQAHPGEGKGGGVGLGLAICARLAQLLGGRLWCESSLGKGTSFHFVVPAKVAEIPKTAVVKAQQLDSAPEPESLEVLVAEDHPVNQLLLRRLLERRGWRVRVVSDGPAVVPALGEQAADLLLLDLKLESTDGLSVARQIRAAEAQGQRFCRFGRYLPIVVVTAQAWQEDRDRCLAAGADGYVVKPIQTDELFRVIGGAVERARAGKAA
jgi:CheY-like chemotaxis protein/two-component sensor histidine kinase